MNHSKRTIHSCIYSLCGCDFNTKAFIYDHLCECVCIYRYTGTCYIYRIYYPIYIYIYIYTVLAKVISFWAGTLESQNSQAFEGFGEDAGPMVPWTGPFPGKP